MKKRLLCLLLALVMLLACLAGCGKKTDEEAVENMEEDASESAVTLSMYLLADNLPEDADARKAQIQSVENAVNRLTKAKFKTQIDLRVFATEEEYYAALDTAYSKDIASGGAVAPAESDETKEDETFVDDLGVVQIKYPDISDYQVDILYLGGYERFSEYKAAEKLQLLDSELDTSAKKIKEYVSTSYLKYMKSANGGTYAIPANEAIGEYTYLLLDKNVLASLDYNTSAGIASIGTNLAAEGFADYLELVKARSGAGDTTEGYAPFVSELTNTELASLCIIDGKNSDKSADVPSKLHYFGVDENGQFTSSNFSLFTGTADAGAVFGDKTNSYMSTADATYTSINNRLSSIMAYRNDDLLVDAEGANGAAVKVVKGSYADREAYEDQYEVIVVENPVIETGDLYENMFAVSKYTSSVARSMEIITYLYTSDELHNVLAFGVEGDDYELIDSAHHLNAEGAPLKIVRDLDASYGISPSKLGNTLIGHYREDIGDIPEYREAVMKQNNDSTVDILMGFTYSANNVAPETVSALARLSAELETIINGFTKADYANYQATVRAFFSEKVASISPINTTIAPAEGDPVSVLLAYRAWADSVGIFVESVASD